MLHQPHLVSKWTPYGSLLFFILASAFLPFYLYRSRLFSVSIPRAQLRWKAKEGNYLFILLTHQELGLIFLKDWTQWLRNYHQSLCFSLSFQSQLNFGKVWSFCLYIMAPVHSGLCGLASSFIMFFLLESPGASARTTRSALCHLHVTWLLWCSRPFVSSCSWYLWRHLLVILFHPSRPSSPFSYSLAPFRKINCWLSKGFHFWP